MMTTLDAKYTEVVTLRDGSRVTLRPIRPDDAERLQEAYRRLSPESIYNRFLTTARELSDLAARKFANIDYHTEMALVGSAFEDGHERLVVSSRYHVIEGRPGIAEAAIVVRDDYQRKGLGTIIMYRLLQHAKDNGIKGIVATVHSGNHQVRNFIDSSGLKYTKKMIEPGVWEILISLEEGDEE